MNWLLCYLVFVFYLILFDFLFLNKVCLVWEIDCPVCSLLFTPSTSSSSILSSTNTKYVLDEELSVTIRQEIWFAGCLGYCRLLIFLRVDCHVFDDFALRFNDKAC